MKVYLIEDEPAAANRLKRALAAIDPAIEVVGEAASIAQAEALFRDHGQPDLALMDIRLEDGDSFTLFERVEVACPVIFISAFDEHALKAFRVNALDYLLKPVQEEELRRALERVHRMGLVRDHVALADRSDEAHPVAPIRRFLIRYGDHYKVVRPEEIAYFHSREKNTFLRTREGRDLPLDESLDRLEKQLDTAHFYRLNRQLIAHFDSITDLLAYSKSRVKVKLVPAYEDDAVVSSERSADFKRWLAGR
ncbi:MAG: response regulator transcription factor [Flavobacteriales bacterium]|nr:response regulator transcription factor [Flavobacteriales bacterium]